MEGNLPPPGPTNLNGNPTVTQRFYQGKVLPQNWSLIPTVPPPFSFHLTSTEHLTFQHGISWKVTTDDLGNHVVSRNAGMARCRHSEVGLRMSLRGRDAALPGHTHPDDLQSHFSLSLVVPDLLCK